MFKIGAGHQPHLWSKSTEPALTLPQEVSMIELGLTQYQHLRHGLPHLNLSLHLARNPITEAPAVQDEYIHYIVEQLDPIRMPVSIGLHLTNEQDSGIGRYGFSSHYIMTPEREALAIRFIKKMKSKTGLPVWLENANFYSSSQNQVLSTWQSYRRILEAAHALAIIDLTHLFIDSKNVGLDPYLVLGSVSWERIAQIHLSGWILGTDGTYHDGHSQPVSPEIWAALEKILHTGLLPIESTYFTIEHTDPIWNQQPHEYKNDFDRLINTLQSANSRDQTYTASNRAHHYAHTFLFKQLQRQVPQLFRACEQRNISSYDLFDAWIECTLKNSNRRILLSKEEVPTLRPTHHSLAATDFLNFAKERIKKYETRS